LGEVEAFTIAGNGNREQGKTVRVALTRNLRLFDITMIGVGAMIGAGIFVLTGLAAGQAGPALLLAFFLNGSASVPSRR
jgi:L-asparagine transporter-like permease